MEPKIRQIQEALTCPVCLDVPESPPIHQCELGHIHCKTCHPNLQNCPVCRSRKIGSRALFAEQTMAIFFTKCKYPNCPVLKLENIQEHEIQCEFAPVQCDFCHKLMDRVTLFVHECFVECHLCSEEFLRHEIGGHITNCDYRRITCPNFGCEVRHFAFDLHSQNEHGEVCEYQIVECQNRGCDFDTTLRNIGELDTHKEICGFQLVECQNNGCTAEVPLQEFFALHKETCQFAPVKCDFCFKMVDRGLHHLYECYVKCHFCLREYLRYDIEDHTTNCDHRRIICPNYGCDVTILANDLISQNEHKHLCEYQVVECQNMGCDFVTILKEVRALNDHKETCGFQLVECQNNGCVAEMPLQESFTHAEDCQYQNVMSICELCGEAFDTKRDLMNHRSERHIDTKCDVCDKCFKSKSGLRKHQTVKGH